EYTWQTYNEIHQRVKNLGCGLVVKGVTTNQNIGLFAINRVEWVIAEHACFMFSLVTVPLYDTLGSEAIEYICTQTKLGLTFATKDKAAVMLKLKPKLPDLKTIVVLDSVDQAIIDSGRAVGVEVVSIVDVENLGSKNPADPVPPGTETIATICYTSGTTGLPKGVMLSHGNMLAFTAGMNENYSRGRFSGVSGDDVYMSYLPLAHVFERACQITVINHGASIGFFRGSAVTLLDDVAELKPTIFPSVPRVYNRIFDRVNASVKSKSAISQFLFNKAFSAKKYHLQRGSLTHWLWDRLVFSSVRSRLGGRCRMLLTGAAPISAEVMDFLRICFSCQVYEGYGQTETCASLSVSDMNDLSSGHVGVPNPCTQVKLIDVPSMNYTSADKPFPRGEICVKGACVFKGYYNSPDKTAECLDADGWLRTGDVGMWDSQGRLAIIDRVK
ncbi:Long chain acyl-CoA synthetase 7 peroxisomal, partial [Cladochytrium tenue]